MVALSRFWPCFALRVPSLVPTLFEKFDRNVGLSYTTTSQYDRRRGMPSTHKSSRLGTHIRTDQREGCHLAAKLRGEYASGHEGRDSVQPVNVNPISSVHFLICPQSPGSASFVNWNLECWVCAIEASLLANGEGLVIRFLPLIPFLSRIAD